MKLYISVDAEGISGQSSWKQVMPDERGYQTLRRLMTADANAAIAGAKAAGVDEIVVNDSHDGMMNLLLEELDPDARHITGSPKLWSMVEGLDASCDLAFFIGYHAMGGGYGVLAHTYNLQVQQVTLNGKALGETGINAFFAGIHGVPVGLVSGDDRVAAEAEALLGTVETAVVKRAVSRFGVDALSPERARTLIRLKAEQAVRQRSRFTPLRFAPPYRLEVTFCTAGEADMAALVPESRRLDARTVAYSHDDPLEAMRAFRALSNLGTMGVD